MRSKSHRLTKMAQNSVATMPMVSVTAKPRIGPVPNWNRKSAAIRCVAFESRIAESAFEKPASIAARLVFPASISSLMRSKISTFESTPMPIVRMKPATPGSVITAPAEAMNASRMRRFRTTVRIALMPDSL